MDSLYFEGTWFVSFGRVVSHVHSNWDIHEKVAIFVLGASYKTVVVFRGGGLHILYFEQVSTVVNPFSSCQIIICFTRHTLLNSTRTHPLAYVRPPKFLPTCFNLSTQETVGGFSTNNFAFAYVVGLPHFDVTGPHRSGEVLCHIYF